MRSRRGFRLPVIKHIMESYYEILGIGLNSSITDIKKEYRKLIKEIHPDISGTDYDSTKFMKINEAYKTLIHPEKRLLYNQTLMNIPIIKEEDEGNCRVIYSRSLEVLARRGFLSTLLPKHKRKQMDLEYDVILIIDKSRPTKYYSFNIDIPTKIVCPICGSRDHYCTMCTGKGYLVRPFKVKIKIPPDIKFGEIFEVDLSSIKQKELRVFRAQKIRIKVIFLHHLLAHKKKQP